MSSGIFRSIGRLLVPSAALVRSTVATMSALDSLLTEFRFPDTVTLSESSLELRTASPLSLSDCSFVSVIVIPLYVFFVTGSSCLNQMLSAEADGMTIAYVANTDTNGNIMLDGVTYGLEDFAPIARFAADPHVIVASNASGITDLEGLIAAGEKGNTL